MKQENPRQQIIITNLIDWSKSFVDEDGTFYCGTTAEQKEATRKVLGLADLVIYASDLHPLTAPEHQINGGLYPVHNAVLPGNLPKDFVYARGPTGNGIRLGERTASPELTDVLKDALQDRKAGIYVARSVYFPDGSQEPMCTPQDIEETFGEKTMSPRDFLDGNYTFITAPKQYFDATSVDEDFSLPKTVVAGVSDSSVNIYSLIKMKFPEDKYDLVFVNTGVVEGICRLQTSLGIQRKFMHATHVNLLDATTPLLIPQLGFATAEESRDACVAIGRQVGIRYMTTQDFMEEYTR